MMDGVFLCIRTGCYLHVAAGSVAAVDGSVATFFVEARKRAHDADPGVPDRFDEQCSFQATPAGDGELASYASVKGAGKVIISQRAI